MKTFFRHSKGNGKKFNSAEACPLTYLSKTSVIRGNSDIFEAVINNSENEEIIDSYIYGAQIFNSTVIGTVITGKVRIENSLLMCKSVAGHSRISNSIVEGESRVYGSADVVNSSFKNLSVSGTAKILDWNLFLREHGDDRNIFDGLHGRLTSGIWKQPPRIVRFDDLEITVTESTNGRAFVGCVEKDMRQWISGGYRFGRVNGWTTGQVKRLVDIFNLWLANPMSNN